MINYNLLETKIDEYNKIFHNAKPYKYLIVDNFLNQEFALKAFQVFPKMEEMDKLKDIKQYKAQDP